MSRTVLVWGVAMALLGAQPVGAATVCRFTGSAGLSFGGYDILAAQPRDSQTDVRVTCSRDGGPANVNVTLAIGPSSQTGSAANRTMVAIGTGTPLAYGLYRDSGRSLLWGNGPSDSAMRTVSIQNKSSATLTFTIYGRIPAAQNVLAGSYSDTVQLTVTP